MYSRRRKEEGKVEEGKVDGSVCVRARFLGRWDEMGWLRDPERTGRALK